ncbi:MAG TPA: hypothetical protein VKR58_02275 [Aquella sp.]|nr:hypothetical protein [Aquella sp.]
MSSEETSTEQEYEYSPPLEPLIPTDTYRNPSPEDGTKVKLTQGDKNYELTISRRLGEGGFGTVYKCVDSSGKEYALKKSYQNRIVVFLAYLKHR